MEIITSKENKKIKSARQLLTRKGRKQSGNYLIEGFHLLEEALKAKAELVEIFVSTDKIEKVPAGLSFIAVSADVLRSLASSDTPQGIVAIVKKMEAVDFEMGKVLILEDVQDPGNVGTMIRTADAAGFDAVFTTNASADIYSPKVMRAMQGSHFHLAVVDGVTFENLVGFVRDAGLELLVSTLSKNSINYKAVKMDRFALVMGNEGNGVSDFAVKNADQLVHIEMPGQAESLNVAVAAGILMFAL